MAERGLPVAALRPVLALASRWAFSPRADWPTARRRIELALWFPGAPRGTAVRSLVVGGVRCDELVPASAAPGTVLLFLHGGGYVTCSPRTHRSLAARIGAAIPARTLVVDYRLAPEHPYPAGLEDVRAVWATLTGAEGIDPARIVVVGDSAGGGLALALTLALRDAGEPLPAALGLICPWLDLTLDVSGRRRPSAGDVAMRPGLLRRFAHAFLAGAGGPVEDPLVSPVHADLAGLPPLAVQTCSEDVLRPDGLLLVQRARAAGVPVAHEELAGLWHDAQLSAALLAEPVGGAPLRIAGALAGFLA